MQMNNAIAIVLTDFKRILPPKKESNFFITKFMHATLDNVYVRMLNTFDGKVSCWKNTFNEVFPNQTHMFDMDSFKYLVKERLISFDHKEGNTKYYHITDNGQKVLDIARDNYAASRVLAWFDGKTTDENIYAKVIDNDIMCKRNSAEDFLPNTICKMLSSLLDTSSAMYEIGSAFRFLNKLIMSLSKYDFLFSAFDNSEVRQWIDDNALKMDTVKKFKCFFDKLSKKKTNNHKQPA